MTELETIRDSLRRAAAGDPWHGPSLQTLLRDVSAREAAQHPIAGAHSIWEMVLHITGWVGEVARRMDGTAPALPAAGDWPEVSDTSAAAWDRARSALAAAHEALDRKVAALDSARLGDRVGTLDPNAALGTGVTLAAMLHGLAQHDAYHGGQIAMLVRAVRA